MLTSFLSLVDILQVSGPVRVDFVSQPRVPRFRSFGPIPRASSEGFLDSFTPSGLRLLRKRVGEVIFSYSLSTKSFFFHDVPGTTEKLQQDRVLTRKLVTCRQQPFVPTKDCETHSNFSSIRSTVPMGSSTTEPDQSEKRLSSLEMRSNVMTPNSVFEEFFPTAVYWDLRTQLMRPFEKGRNTKNQRIRGRLYNTTPTVPSRRFSA